jgi:hypothetical protein
MAVKLKFLDCNTQLGVIHLYDVGSHLQNKKKCIDLLLNTWDKYKKNTGYYYTGYTRFRSLLASHK